MNRWLAEHVGRRIYRSVVTQGDVYQVIKLLPDAALEYAAALIADRMNVPRAPRQANLTTRSDR